MPSTFTQMSENGGNSRDLPREMPHCSIALNSRVTSASDEHHWSVPPCGARMQISSVLLLASIATMLIEWIGSAKALDKPPRASLLVTPPSGIALSGPQGGPFSPSSFEYRVSASAGAINYSIKTPSWLTANSSFGTAGTSGVAITLTVNSTALQLPPGAYGPGVAFTNTTNGQGSTTRSARLIIQAPSPPPSPSTRAPWPSTHQGRKGSGGYLLDNGPGHLLDHLGRKLLAE